MIRKTVKMRAMKSAILDRCLQQLEKKCPDCKGEGGHFDPIDGYGYYCPRCNGAGYLPTKTGRQVLSLIRHNFSLLATAAKESD